MNAIPVEVGADIRIPIRSAPQPLLERLKGLRIEGACRPGECPPVYAALERDGQWWRLPRGLIGELRAAARDSGFRIDAKIDLIGGGDPVPHGLPLRDYQQSALDRIVARKQGYIVIPCGGGKTYIGVAATSALRQRTLILCHTRDLALQWTQSLLGAGIHAGMIGGGADHEDTVTVALIQALTAWPTERLDGLLSRFGALILDEAHHVAADTFGAIVGRSPALYKIGLTATPDRRDGLGGMLGWYFGPELLRVTAADLQARGLRVPLQVDELRIADKLILQPPRYARAGNEGRDLFQSAEKAIFGSIGRIEAIAARAVDLARDGHSVLVLGRRVEYCRRLAAACTARGIEARGLTGELSGKARAQTIADAKSGSLSILCGTSIADEGLDIPRLSAAILAWPTSADAVGLLEQRIGRIARPYAGKTHGIVIDVHDAGVPILSAMWRKRQRVLEDICG